MDRLGQDHRVHMGRAEFRVSRVGAHMYSGRERALCWKQVHLGAPQCKATGGKREGSQQQTLSFQGWEVLEAVEDREEMRNKQVLDIKEQGGSEQEKAGAAGNANGPDHIETETRTTTERPLGTTGSGSMSRQTEKRTACGHGSCRKVKKSGWEGKEGDKRGTRGNQGREILRMRRTCIIYREKGCGREEETAHLGEKRTGTGGDHREGRPGFTQIGAGLPAPREAVAFPALMK